MFAYRIAVNYLVSDYINFKFFYLTWENPLMKNSLPNKVRDKSSYFLIDLAWIYCHLTSFSRAPQEWEKFFFQKLFAYTKHFYGLSNKYILKSLCKVEPNCFFIPL